jgi:hypothetical protein
MIKILYNSLILLLLLFITSCNTSEKLKLELPLEVVKTEVSAWLNLMPGVSPGKFHLTGELTLKNLGDKEINNISLDNIIVYVSEEVIYSFKPYFKDILEEDNFNLKAGMNKVFAFGIEEGLKIDKRLEKNEIINTKFSFVSDEGMYSYSIDSIKVVKAY